MNSCVFVGRVGQDPQPIGQVGMRLSIAVDDYNASTKQRETIWVPLVVFGKQADTVRNYVSKGRRIAVQCRFNIRESEYQGQTRKEPQFIVERLDLLDGGSAANGTFGQDDHSRQPTAGGSGYGW